MKKYFLIGIGALLVLLVPYFISAKFTAEKFEQSIIAQDEQMQNVHGAMENALKMQGFTVKNYTESDLKKLEIGIKRYADKPQLMMQWAQEQGNTLSPDLHKKFMDAIDKFYVKWEMTQKSKISVVQEYRTYLKSSIKGTISTVVFSYPNTETKIIMDRIISTGKTKEAWAAGVDEVSNPFK